MHMVNLVTDRCIIDRVCIFVDSQEEVPMENSIDSYLQSINISSFTLSYDKFMYKICEGIETDADDLAEMEYFLMKSVGTDIYDTLLEKYERCLKISVSKFRSDNLGFM